MKQKAGFLKDIIDAIFNSSDPVEDTLDNLKKAQIDRTLIFNAYQQAEYLRINKNEELINHEKYEEFVTEYNKVHALYTELNKNTGGNNSKKNDQIDLDQYIYISNKLLDCENNLMNTNDKYTYLTEDLKNEIERKKEQLKDYKINTKIENKKLSNIMKTHNNDNLLCQQEKDVIQSQLDTCLNENIELNTQTGGNKKSKSDKKNKKNNKNNDTNIFTQLKSVFNTIAEKASGGMVPKARKKWDGLYEKELQKYKEIKNRKEGELKGGGVFTIVIVVIKLFLFTIGNFIFDWWPIVFIISLYCAAIEYKIIKTMGQSIWGFSSLTIAFACCCPCCWTFLRLFRGYENSLGKQTQNLYHILSNCSSGTNVLDIQNYYSRPCEGTKCFWTSDKCFKTLYPDK